MSKEINQQTIKEFREKFGYQSPDSLFKAIETFWLSKLKAQNQDLLKKIEEMKKDNFKEGTFTYAFQDLRNRAMQEGYNQALKDIKKLIK